MYLHKQTSNEKKNSITQTIYGPLYILLTVFRFLHTKCDLFAIVVVLCFVIQKAQTTTTKKRYQIWIFSWLICVHHSEGPNNPLYGIWPKKVRERSYWTILEMVSNRHSLYPISFPIVQMVLSLSFRCHSFDMKQILIVFLSIRMVHYWIRPFACWERHSRPLKSIVPTITMAASMYSSRQTTL